MHHRYPIGTLPTAKSFGVSVLSTPRRIILIMKRNISTKYVGGILGASLLLGMPSCSDDHFDIKPGAPAAGKTIWQNVEEHANLKSMAGILKRIKVYAKEDHYMRDDSTRALTYADLLNSSQSYTLWAPLNGKFDADVWNRQLDQVDELRAAGKKEEANKLEYRLGMQFAQNHMARFNYEANKGTQEVRLFNGKLAIYNATEGRFNGAPLATNEALIPASNGTIHLLDGVSPFAYNVFDYMQNNSDVFKHVYGTLSDPKIDKKEFSEVLSIPGAMNENGQMVYVDSVYITSNELLNQSGAQIKNEDSLYIAVIPTDPAWEVASANISKLFKYKNSYSNEFNYTTGKFNPQAKYTFDPNNTKDWQYKSPDSLQLYNTEKLLITSMYFSPSIFEERFERDDIDGILDYAYHADTLRSTNGWYYANPMPKDPATGKRGKNPLFGDVEPVKASNGIVFPLTTYSLDPAYSFIARIVQELSYGNTIGDTENIENGSEKGEVFTLVAGENKSDSVDYSDWKDQSLRYRYLQVTRNKVGMIPIPLPNVLSGKYLVKVQVMPNRADINHAWYDPEDPEKEIAQNTKFTATLLDDEGNIMGKKSQTFEVDEDSVKTYTLWPEGVEFPYCYQGLPTGVSSFPFLRIDVPRQKTPTGMSPALSLIKVILEPIRDEAVKE